MKTKPQRKKPLKPRERTTISCPFCGTDHFAYVGRWYGATATGRFFTCGTCGVRMMLRPDSPTFEALLSLSEVMKDPALGPALRQLLVGKTEERAARNRYVQTQVARSTVEPDTPPKDDAAAG